MMKVLKKIYICEQKIESLKEELEIFEKYLEDIKKEKIQYKIIYSKKLSYVVPIAFQSIIGLILDFNGNYINNPNEKNSEYFSLCIFPFENESLILIFEIEKNIKYLNFWRDFGKKDENEQLSILNYIIFSLSEDYRLSTKISNEVLKELEPLAIKLDELYSPNLMTKNEQLQKWRQKYDYEDHMKYPNILSEIFNLK